MYERVKVSDKDFYMDCPSKIGMIQVSDTEAVFIDSGNDKDAGKKALKLLAEWGLSLRAVLNTHSHADHIGGNRLLADRTGCKIYAYGKEIPLVREPYLEPAMTYGGYPLPELRNKKFMAEPSDALPLKPEDLPDGMEMIHLPGHSPDQVAFLTKDGTLYAGDAITPVEVLRKYGLGYIWNVEETLKSLEVFRTLEAKTVVPSHGPLEYDIPRVADFNRDTILGNGERILGFITGPLTHEKILQKTFQSYGIPLNVGQYALIGCVLRAYLSWLTDRGEITYELEDGQLYFLKK